MIRHAFRLQTPELDDPVHALSSTVYDGITPGIRFGMDRQIDIQIPRLMKTVETEWVDGQPCHVERLCCSEDALQDVWVPYKLRYTYEEKKIDFLFLPGLSRIYGVLFPEVRHVRDPMEVLLDRHGILDLFRKNLRGVRDVALFLLGADHDLSETLPYTLTHLYEDFLSDHPERIGPDEVRTLMAHLSQDQVHYFRWIDPWTAGAIEEGTLTFHPRQETTLLDRTLFTPAKSSLSVRNEDFNHTGFPGLLKAVQALPCTDFHISFFLRHLDRVDTHRLDLPFPGGGVFQDRYRPGHTFLPEETLGRETELMNAVTENRRFTETMLSVHGDELVISLQGSFDERLTLTVSREGETLRTFLWDRALLSLFSPTVTIEDDLP